MSDKKKTLKEEAEHFRMLATTCREEVRAIERKLEEATAPTRFLPRSFPTIRAVVKAWMVTDYVRARSLRESADAYDDIAAVYESAEWAP